MNGSKKHSPSRREFLKNTSRMAAASALAGVSIPYVHAAPDNTIQLALIGCGGRGTGAVRNAFSVKGIPIKLVSMADVFEHRIKSSHDRLNERFSGQLDVPQERRFLGFDAYKKAMDALKPGDIAIFASPPAFRWVHFDYAIQKGLHVFMEKPVTVDGPTTRKMLQLAGKADEKNLKVGVGLMVRHCRSRQALKERIDSGQIGDILMMRAYRMHRPVGSAFSDPNPGELSDLLYQVQRFHSFLWASGGLYSDFYIHQIDELCWMKGEWPVQAHAVGGRHYRGNAIDQNFDSYSVEYTFADGSKLFLDGRTMNGCHDEFASYAHGTKGVGIVSTDSHTPGKCRIYQGHTMAGDPAWAFPQPEQNPYDLEWEDLIEAIQKDKPFNETKRGAQASLVTSMGRMAAHMGQVITYDEILHSPHEFAPTVGQLTMNSAAPLKVGADGKYPVPMPGVVTDREY